MEIFDEIIQKEKALHSFEVRSSESSLDQYISDDFKEIGSTGAYFDKSNVLGRLPKENDWSCESYDYECRRISESVILVVYMARIAKSGMQAKISRRSSIWVNENGAWKVSFHQGTNVVE